MQFRTFLPFSALFAVVHGWKTASLCNAPIKSETGTYNLTPLTNLPILAFAVDTLDQQGHSIAVSLCGIKPINESFGKKCSGEHTCLLDGEMAIGSFGSPLKAYSVHDSKIS